jgi:hypothetical protein
MVLTYKYDSHNMHQHVSRPVVVHRTQLCARVQISRAIS